MSDTTPGQDSIKMTPEQEQAALDHLKQLFYRTADILIDARAADIFAACATEPTDIGGTLTGEYARIVVREVG